MYLSVFSFAYQDLLDIVKTKELIEVTKEFVETTENIKQTVNTIDVITINSDYNSINNIVDLNVDELLSTTNILAELLRTLSYDELLSMMSRLTEFNDSNNFADVLIFQFEHKYPVIFNQIEMADNATDFGYFRKEYKASNKIKRLEMLKEFFELE